MKAIKTAEDVKAMPIGTWADFKSSLITRDVYRVSEDKFEINDCSDGWQIALVDLNTMIDLILMKKSMINLDWE
jgi:hypothetical protein